METLRNDFWFIHEYISTVFVCGFELQNKEINWKLTGFIWIISRKYIRNFLGIYRRGRSFIQKSPTWYVCLCVAYNPKRDDL